jgi:hypothetical protein
MNKITIIFSLCSTYIFSQKSKEDWELVKWASINWEITNVFVLPNWASIAHVYQ